MNCVLKRMCSSSKIPNLNLNTGAKMPQFGLGTWQAINEDEVRNSVRHALDLGYRLIDTAQMYQNEHVIGEVLEEYIKAGKIKRSDVFLTTKLPFYAMEPADADAMIPRQLAALRTDYVDLYLIHTPMAAKPKPGVAMKLDADSLIINDNIEHIDTWRVLENWHKKGALKALGVSNFNARQIESLYKLADVKPANLQVECYLYWPQEELLALTRKLGMTFTAFSPLGSPGSAGRAGGVGESVPLTDPLVLKLAKKHDKTPAQILLRNLLQRGIAIIPKSTNEKRLKENASIFDFELSADELNALARIDKRVRLFPNSFAKSSRHYPFDDVK